MSGEGGEDHGKTGKVTGIWTGTLQKSVRSRLPVRTGFQRRCIIRGKVHTTQAPRSKCSQTQKKSQSAFGLLSSGEEQRSIQQRCMRKKIPCRTGWPPSWHREPVYASHTTLRTIVQYEAEQAASPGMYQQARTGPLATRHVSCPAGSRRKSVRQAGYCISPLIFPSASLTHAISLPAPTSVISCWR